MTAQTHSDDKPDAIAREIMRQHQDGETYANLSGDLAPTDAAEAYAAQFRLHELQAKGPRGPLGGRKIALASAVQQELCGVDHPIAGGVFASEIHQSPTEIRLADYHGLGLEFELAAILGEDIAPGSGPFDAKTIRSRIAELRPAFEMIIDRGADYDDLDALTMMADNAWCGGIVLGPPLAGWRERDVDALPVELFWNQEPPIPATAGEANPLGSLAWVAGELIRAGQTLKAGDAVITGSVIRTRAPVPGDHVRYRVGDEEVELKVL